LYTVYLFFLLNKNIDEKLEDLLGYDFTFIDVVTAKNAFRIDPSKVSRVVLFSFNRYIEIFNLNF
jgi:hypothetical protein